MRLVDAEPCNRLLLLWVMRYAFVQWSLLILWLKLAWWLFEWLTCGSCSESGVYAYRLQIYRALDISE